MNDRPTPETDAFAKAMYSTGVDCHHDGREALKHAERLERERDEAREDADHWKTEYEIVVARLCGKKHPRDNGIVAPDEIIPMLTRERDEAIAARKASAADWLGQIDQVNARVSQALQQVALAERERDKYWQAIIMIDEITKWAGNRTNSVQELLAELDKLKEGGE